MAQHTQPGASAARPPARPGLTQIQAVQPSYMSARLSSEMASAMTLAPPAAGKQLVQPL